MINNTKEIPKRLAPRFQTLRLLLAKSGNQCAFENCFEVIFNNANELVGQCCHIEAALPGGERFNSNQNNEERRSFENLLFLCHKHHLESNDVNIYTVSALKRIKDNHHSKFSEKEFIVNPNHMDSLIEKFNDITANLIETLDSVKRIETKQDELLSKINSTKKQQDFADITDLNGAPAVHNFITRKNEIDKAERNFTNYQTIIFQGVSGIGKSSLASYFTGNLKKYKVLWISCDTITDKDFFLFTLSNFLIQNFNDSSLEKCLSENDERALEYSLINILENHSICIVFDALNKDSHCLFTFAKLFNEKLTCTKIIITTTQNFNILNWRNAPIKIAVGGFSRTELNELAALYNIPKLNPNDFELLYVLIGGHPYLLKLVASIIQYYPIKELLNDLKDRSLNDIEEYIKDSLISEITDDENKLLFYISVLDIPFRYELGKHIPNINFIAAVKSLHQKFILEKNTEDFYAIPEYIKLYLTKKYEALTSDADLLILIDYLKNIGQKRIIEKITYINLLLKADLENTAKNESGEFITSLVKYGHFNLVIKFGTNLLQHSISKNWDFIYFILGRMYRLKREYRKSLAMHDKGIALAKNPLFYNSLLFEKANMLYYLSLEEKSEHLKSQAVDIYNKLINSDDLEISIQSTLALARLVLNKDKAKKVIKNITKILHKTDIEKIQPHIAAQIYHCLGDAYSTDENYNSAIQYFDKSAEYYRTVINFNGLHALDGLYHLYISYATAYSSAGDYNSACGILELNVNLSRDFNLEKKLEQSLLDFGFHLALDGKLDKAIKILQQCYSLMDESALELTKLRILYGTLLFSYWYSNQSLLAVELLGLYINVCIYTETPPTVAVVEKNDTALDLIQSLKKGFIFLIIPENKNINDFENWISEVSLKAPHVADSLQSFSRLK
ncbi:tetratricopeptide repeat protein [Flavobacterium sharifuzzamanii]|uniref:tetratricopeptide repeat protein n=1 Tax=Flavobacterium sharifuzzamanii TaxID=2211133 RepID=UPI000DADD3FC|nr:hypothetical protein [Flavobacterium sharifuzzamanii]KAF2082013.1 hypothetical protein DMA14_05960 [Flavobacterium sharifuzzamanii]